MSPGQGSKGPFNQSFPNLLPMIPKIVSRHQHHPSERQQQLHPPPQASHPRGNESRSKWFFGTRKQHSGRFRSFQRIVMGQRRRMPSFILLSSCVWLSYYYYWITSYHHQQQQQHHSLVQQQQLKQQQQQQLYPDSNTMETSIAYAVVITGCEPMRDSVEPFKIAEGAAVLKYSIANRALAPNSTYTALQQHFYAIYHPQAEECAKTLGPLGYTLLPRDTPVPVPEIRGDFLRERIVTNGCCGEKELIKFEAYTLVQHTLVVLLDLDVLILKPLDVLFDLILHKKLPEPDDMDRHGQILMWPQQELPTEIEVLHTIDYAMSYPQRQIKPFQGGFAVLRPSQKVYEDFVSIIREGDFRDQGGWGGKTGKFWGAQTFQGLMPYYYHILHPGRSVELHWCTFNNMCSPSRDGGVVKDQPVGKCYTGETTCEDCRLRPVKQLFTVHFTVCQKPWHCMSHSSSSMERRLCRDLHHEWFRARSELEKQWGRSGTGVGKFDVEHFFGYCNSTGQRGYQPIHFPFDT